MQSPFPEKSVVLTPAIAAFEKIIAEYKLLKEGRHPELEKLKKEQQEAQNQRFAVLDKFAEYQRQIIRQQYQCEVQQANEEYDNFVSSEPQNQ